MSSVCLQPDVFVPVLTTGQAGFRVIDVHASQILQADLALEFLHYTCISILLVNGAHLLTCSSARKG